MSVVLLIALALPITSAFFLVRALWWDRAAARAPAGILVALACGGGLGLASYTYMIALLAAGASRASVIGLDGALLAAAAVWWWRRRTLSPRLPPTPWRGGERAALAVVVIAAVGALAAFTANALVNPHGEWDAWAIWNVRARFLFRAGPQWRRAFSAELMHADYPLLLPAAVAHVWTSAAAESNAAPLAVALCFAGALVVLLAAALAYLRGRMHGLLGGLCLLATPLLLRRAAWQYADIPLAFFLLATVALLAVADRAAAAADAPAARGALILAGALAGMAAWTKNEGALFVVAVVAVRALCTARARTLDWRRAAAFAIGLAPGALVLAYFKLVLAPRSYLFADQHVADYAARLLDPSRYAVIATVAGAVLLQSLGIITVAVPVAVLLLGRTRDATARRAAAWVGLLLALVALGYAAVYLVTPLDLDWQLRHSLDRLLLQLWPSVLFAVLLATASPQEWRGETQPAPPAGSGRPRPRRPARR